MYVGLRVPVKGVRPELFTNSGLQSGWPICQVNISTRIYILAYTFPPLHKMETTRREGNSQHTTR